jgi:hypothetical protein
VLDDFEEVYKNFAIQFAYIKDELKAQIVINKGNGSCGYLVNNQCSIYDERPPACKMYPISPYYEDFYIDVACPAITDDADKGEWICSNEGFNSKFYHKRVDNFLYKLEDTMKFLTIIKDDLEPSIVVQGIQLYNYTGKLDNEHIKMYKESLKHLDK